jgi:hypothetical protein
MITILQAKTAKSKEHENWGALTIARGKLAALAICLGIAILIEKGVHPTKAYFVS